jgi:3-hydroxyacyl-CoA dehydrogenase
MTRFGADRLGKGVVVCKDTPNFIANRIGVYALARTLLSALQAGLSVEEVDLATGPILGRPRSATFRTFDLIGIDTYVHVARNLYESLPDDPEREVFRVPALLETLAERRWLGDKTGQGFYRRARGKTEFLDPATLEYRPPENPKLAVLEKARSVDDLAARTRKLVFGSDRIGAFLWEVVGSTLAYAAAKIPEISDDCTSVDNAIKWGFGHELGPFETWDALGVARAVERLRREKRKVPPLVESLLASGGKSFYRRRGGRTYSFAPSVRSFVREPEPEGVISLRALKERKKVVESNPSASLIDLGDGVACLEFHSKLNTIDADTVELIHAAVDRVAREFVGLVVANEGENFSAGANLVAVLEAARAERWDAIEAAVRRFQDANMRLRYSDKPVVAAPHQRALGGGCEIALHCDQIHAAAELYMGFVEVGVGLVPAGGGCKEMVRAAADACAGSALQLDERTRDAFERIATARVSGSALEAREMGFLRPQDHITLNADRRIHHAKADVLALAREAYAPGAPRQDIVVLGEPALASLKLTLHMMERAGYITEYERVVGTRLATVLAGGKFLGVSRVSEQYLLDLEREAFLSLAGEPKTQERMEYMLREGKPLRN